MPEHIGFIKLVDGAFWQPMFGEVAWERSEGGEPMDMDIELIWICPNLLTSESAAATVLKKFIRIRREAGLPV